LLEQMIYMTPRLLKITARTHLFVTLLMATLIAPIAVPILGVAEAGAAGSAVVLMYHRFDEPEYPSTNITLEQFEAHITELKSGPYTVLPLSEIISRMKNGPDLPDFTVGISVDDAYASVYQKAWPRLKQAGLPFTVFASTARVGRSTAYMNWDQLREMSDGGVTIGNHTVTHAHLPIHDKAIVKEEIAQAAEILEKELGTAPDLFAYPYGESSLAVEEVVRAAGFKAAFAQHSGAFDRSVNSFYLPRFALSEKYGHIDRFRMIIRTLPIPVTDVTPRDSLIADVNPPAIGFTVTGDTSRLGSMSCFVSHEGRARIERLGSVRFEIRITKPMPKGRSRLSCTYRGEKGRFHWMGRQFYNP